MKKLTAGIFATLLAVVSADSAYAAIASSGYVDEKVGEVQTAVDAVEGNVSTLQSTVGQHTTQIAAKADSSTVTALGGRVTTAEGEIDTLQTTVAGKQDALGFTPENSTNKTTTLSGTSTDAQYPSAKAVWDTIQTETTGIASDADVTELKGRVGELETASATHATKTELSSGLAAKANTADLGDLAELDAVGSAQITDGAVATADIADKAVTEAKLSDTVNASLDKADSALQKTTADAAYAVKALETQVGTVSKENMGTTTATTVVGGVKEAIDAAKAADTKAAGAQSAVDTVEATIGGYGDIVTHNASDFATAAQGTKADTAVQPAAISDMLTKTEAGTTYYTKTSGDALAGRVTTAEGEIDGIQSQISNMATSETVTNLTNRVTTAEGDITALETAVNDAESGLAATNAIADEALANAATAQSAAEAAQTAAETAQSTADKKQDKLTGTIGGSMQPVYLNNGTITAGATLGSLATKSTVTNADVADGALAQSKISGLATSLAAKLTTPPTSENGETGLYVLTYDGTDFQWEDIARTVAE